MKKIELNPNVYNKENSHLNGLSPLFKAQYQVQILAFLPFQSR